ncbi:MAG: AAA family ATPase, partial [Rhodobiaceae bacterium]|nr:AAA family ATPase [Rhodobiaceae bacterium]
AADIAITKLLYQTIRFAAVIQDLNCRGPVKTSCLLRVWSLGFMLLAGSGGFPDGKKRKTAHVIVCGNEKGGSGKSTTAMHIAVALLRSGYAVATVDLDGRQLSLTRYVENRRRWARMAGLSLAIPQHFHVPPARRETVSDNESEEFRQLTDGLADIENAHDFVVIDTPGSDTFLNRIAHRIA